MPNTESILKELVGRLSEAAGDNLVSVVLFGSAARGDFHERRSDLNVLCCISSASMVELKRLAAAARWWTEHENQPPLLIFTETELRQSADVFAIEILDMQKHHRVLFGKDPVAGVSVPMNLHRVEVEHELRSALLKLRQHYLRTSDDSDALAQVAVKSFSSVLALLRHALIAFGDDVPGTSQEVIQHAAQRTGANAQSLLAVYALREKGQNGDVRSMYGNYLAALETVIAALDRQLPKHEWKRVHHA